MESVAANDFDRSKPFYPLVINYLVTLHGFLELASRHMVTIGTPTNEGSGSHDEASVTSTADEPIAGAQLEGANDKRTSGAVTPLISRLALRSEVEATTIDVDPDELAAEVFEHHNYLLPWTIRAAGMLLVAAWETTKSSSDQSPIWEFLRHCRNAAGHSGRFNLRHGEPRRAAAWRTLTIAPTLQGFPLFKGYTGTGLLSPGDPLWLLWDIEQASPELNAGLF